MRLDVNEYVRLCASCQHNKSSSAAPSGPLTPLPIPNERWESVSMDLITSLPKSHLYDAIFVVVDRLSKMVCLAPTHTTVSAEKLATLFVDLVIRRHGVPESIVSDRDSKFTSAFWEACHALARTASD